MQLTLNSPSNGVPLEYTWPIVGHARKDGCNEAIDLIRYTLDEYPIIRKYFNLKSFAINSTFNTSEIMSNVCSNFNIIIEKLKCEGLLNEKLWNKRASIELARYFMQLIYSKSVANPDSLNRHYEPFSPQVYGETSFDLINDMLKCIKLKENDVFVDLGSGVGNVVLQVAMSTKCKLCFGIELADRPANYALEMEREFVRYMKWFGKPFSKICLQKGDFLGDYPHNEFNIRDLINDAKLIFVNNYAFGAEVDHQLKLKFSNMSEGSFIVSSKPFCPLNFRINSRNLNDIGTILNTSDYAPLNGKVSWTDKPINYYFHRIDRTLLEKYFQDCKRKTMKDDSSESVTAKSILNKKRNSAASSDGSTLSTSSVSTNDDLDMLDVFDNEKNHFNNTNKKQNHKKAKKGKSPSIVKDTLVLMHAQSIRVCEQISPVNNKVYNLPAMTKMTESNVATKLLKDCTIMDLDELNLREHLGPLVTSDLDDHMIKMRKMFLQYLCSMKTPEYKERVLREIEKEKEAKEQLLNKHNQLLNQINFLVKSNVSLLKLRAKELGLDELNSSQELIQLAQRVYDEHQELTQKVNCLQESIDLLEQKYEVREPNDTETDTASEKGSSEEEVGAKKVVDNRCVSSHSEPILSLLEQNDNSLTSDAMEKSQERPMSASFQLNQQQQQQQQQQKQQTNGYYHPKKTQFKQYLMQNNSEISLESNDKQRTPEKKSTSTIETSPISPATDTNIQKSNCFAPRHLNFVNFN